MGQEQGMRMISKNVTRAAFKWISISKFEFQQILISGTRRGLNWMDSLDSFWTHSTLAKRRAVGYFKLVGANSDHAGIVSKMSRARQNCQESNHGNRQGTEERGNKFLKSKPFQTPNGPQQEHDMKQVPSLFVCVCLLKTNQTLSTTNWIESIDY